MATKKIQQIKIEENQQEPIKENLGAIAWEYVLPYKPTSFFIILSIFGAFLVWLGLNYIHSYIMAIIVIFGLIIIIGKTLVRQELNFFLTEEYIALDTQRIEWNNIKHAVFLPYNNDYLVALHSTSFPYVNIYIPVPKHKIQEISELISKCTEIKDLKTETVIDRLVRFLIF